MNQPGQLFPQIITAPAQRWLPTTLLSGLNVGQLQPSLGEHVKSCVQFFITERTIKPIRVT